MHDLIDQTRAALEQSGAASSDYDLNKGVLLPEGRTLRPAAVLAPIIEGPNGYELILTKRSSALKHHPGQIAFPGGKQDEGDTDLVATALREAREEIGLHSQNVEVLGTFAPHETVTSFTVTPVVALVNGSFDAMPEVGEVSEVFRVPLSHVLQPANFIVEARRWRGQKRLYYTVPYGPYYIWGATARILRAWTDLLPQD
ncbi:CoA pyrophosphatase [Tateyamaria omphalii]|uniref:CoA pyrophosphatase n=1 Tax=Tateyamaria omphalii TaxID=299262 RepID=A0A1P8MYN2_9RHOB|nr:CoA pyrophosphatase [Tateyamaria omphalii]APX13133.1 CoA pyrophosphatase [Tateyamaria omphalii]